MYVWDEGFDWRQLDGVIEEIEKKCKPSPLSKSMDASMLARYVFWVVYADLQGRLDAYVHKGLKKAFGNPRQYLRELAQKVDTLAEIVAKTVFINPFLPVPPLGIPEQLRAYADQLRKYASRDGKPQRGWPQKWSDRGSEMLHMLVRSVTRRTGRPHHQDIADILNSTAELLGVKTEIPGRGGQTRLIYDVAALKMRLKRTQSRFA